MKNRINKYHFDIKINDRGNNAGTKATDDCKKILLEKGYKNLEINFVKSSFLLPFNVIKLISILIYYIILIPSHSLIFVQYPLKGINRLFKYFIRVLKIKGCKFSCIIHDLESLRSACKKDKIQKEIDFLLAYDAVIAHNTVMRDWLNENGYLKHIEEVILFDYLVENNKFKQESFHFDSKKIKIAFAGNLNKSNFITNLLKASFSFEINLYGPFNSLFDLNNESVKWHGSFSPDQIIEELQGDFGLVWDGDSLENISGSMGNYLMYNTPHKTSLYLVAGLPIIISEGAAMADFIVNNNIGICIKNLASIPEIVNKISDTYYFEMKENVRLLGNKLKHGWYMNQAVAKVENHLYKCSTSYEKNCQS